jgi:DNA-binding LacI/PurR family transcriptional regulator
VPCTHPIGVLLVSSPVAWKKPDCRGISHEDRRAARHSAILLTGGEAIAEKNDFVMQRIIACGARVRLLRAGMALLSGWNSKKRSGQHYNRPLVHLDTLDRGTERGTMRHYKKNGSRPESVITLKQVAQRVQLSPGTVSAVLNDSPSAKHIPENTRNRILAAARELKYKPNFMARSLRNKRTYTIGVIPTDISDGYSGLVIAGIEDYLRERDYFFITGIHHHDPELFKMYSRLLLERGAEGMITIDLNLESSMPVPTVAISGHQHEEGVTRVVLDQPHATRLALEHLVGLGHRDIAVMIGHPESADAAERWQAISRLAPELGVPIRPELTVQLAGGESGPALGYPYAKILLDRKQRFTALFAYNDASAIGAIRAFREAGLRVPQDISVVGFDDIQGAAFHSPSLTTVRQPLRRMGEIAAQHLVDRLSGIKDGPHEVAVEPELVLRESTGPAAV